MFVYMEEIHYIRDANSEKSCKIWSTTPKITQIFGIRNKLLLV